jgi:hypothetical protein
VLVFGVPVCVETHRKVANLRKWISTEVGLILLHLTSACLFWMLLSDCNNKSGS